MRRSLFQETTGSLLLRWVSRSAFIILLCMSKVATATDFTDLWWNPSESGWGVNMAQQADTIFLTFFIYGADNQPTWLSATTIFSGQDAQGSLFFAGDLYTTSGPYYGAPFSASSVQSRKVGTVTFRADTPSSGALSYSVDNTIVNKAIQRQLFKYMNVSGEYLGAITETHTNCQDPAQNGQTASVAKLTIQHSGSQFTMTAANLVNGARCVYQGTYGQAGRLGSVQGTFSCTSPVSGTFVFIEMQQSTAGITARYVGQAFGCLLSGNFGGVAQ